MGLKSLLVSLLIGVLFSAFAFVAISEVFVREGVAALMPPALALETNQSLHVLLIEQAVGLFFAFLLLLIILFFALTTLVLRPIRDIIAALQSSAVDDAPSPLTDAIVHGPKEIKELGLALEAFQEKVAQTHRNDTEVSRVKSDFISTAAHQLRTPLTGIRWALEALEKEPLTEAQKALVTNALEKGHDLVAIVGTLLDISAIESGKFKYNFTPVDMGVMLKEVATSFATFAGEHRVSLFYAEAEEALPKARADQERIKWMLNNLVENAIQYTPANGTVRVSVDGSAERIFVRVRDTGIGIPTNDRANIFERFYRGSNAVSKENGGNGLGLYIARTIATDHGGDLRFESNTPEPGTTFTLSLPTAK